MLTLLSHLSVLCFAAVIDFIDVVRQSKKKVLVHCAQGVSRSTVLAIAYLMYLENSDYDAIYEFVRARRGICRPNVGFMCQLLAWRKRITRCSNRPYCFYRIGPHNNRDPSLVTKWIDRIEVDSMDSRTLFLLQTMVAPLDDENASATSNASSPSVSSAAAASSSASASTPLIYIWVGMLCTRDLEKLYLPYLAHLISKIQALEHAGKSVVIIRQKGRDKIERAEEIQRKGVAAAAAIAAAAAPKTPNGSVPPSPSASTSSSGSSASAAAFSSEHISASFHTLDSAPAILSATSLSSLYPAATPKQISAFYRIVGLEESEDYSRVGSDASHPISGAILLNQSMEDEYASVRVPDVEALNEVALKHAGIFNSAASNNSGGNGASANGLSSPPARPGSRQNSLSRPATPGGGGLHTSGLNSGSGGPQRLYLLPPIVRVGLPDKSGVESAAASDDDDAGVAPAAGSASTTEDESMDAYARNLSANSSASTAKYAALARVGSVSGSNDESHSPVIMLPRKLKLSLGSAGSDGSPSSASSSARDAPSSTPHRGSGSGVGAFVLPSKPKLNLRGITAGGDDSDDSSSSNGSGRAGDVSMSSDAGMATVPVVSIALSSSPSATSSAHALPAGRSQSNSISTPRKVDSSSSAHSSHANSMASTPRQLPTPASAVAASAASAAAAGRSSSATAATPSPSASHLPLYGLYQFPAFEAGPVAVCSRSSLVAPHIFLLHAREPGAIFVWMPASAGQGLFIPSKYEGDRELFAGDIAKAFQISVGLGANMIRAVNVETAGKESDEFLRTLAAGAAATGAK